MNGGRIPSFPLFVGKYEYEKERSFSFPVRSDFRVMIQYRRDAYDQQAVNVMCVEEGEVTRSPVIAEYVVNDVESTIARIENRIESNVTLVFVLDANGMIQLKKAELTSKYISQEGKSECVE